MKNMNQQTATATVNANAANNNTQGSATAETFEQLLARMEVPTLVAHGDIVRGTILPYGDNGHFYVSIGQKSDALLPKKDAGVLQPGDEAEFLVVSDVDGDECVTLSFTQLQHRKEVQGAWESLTTLAASGDTTEVTIIGVETRKDTSAISGVKASFRGLIKGFIPLSLVTASTHAKDLVGTTVQVKVLKAEDKGRHSNVLFSNKAATEALVGAAIEQLEVGSTVAGTVTRIMLEAKTSRNEGSRREIGVLVELQPGVSGLVHKSNLSNDNRVKPSDVLKVGDKVEVKILNVDGANGRISLSYKDVDANREALVAKQSATVREQLNGLTAGEVLTGKVKRIIFERETTPSAEKRELGAIVILPNGTEAFLHRNECSDSRLVSISNLIKEGDEIQTEVKFVDLEQGRVQLSYKKVAANRERIQQIQKELQSSFRASVKVGDKIRGTVARTVPFGAFIRLGGGLEALLHISDIDKDHSRQDEALREYTNGKSVEVTISRIADEGGHTKIWVVPAQA